jgi:hypothetical protein
VLACSSHRRDRARVAWIAPRERLSDIRTNWLDAGVRVLCRPTDLRLRILFAAVQKNDIRCADVMENTPNPELTSL